MRRAADRAQHRPRPQHLRSHPCAGFGRDHRGRAARRYRGQREGASRLHGHADRCGRSRAVSLLSVDSISVRYGQLTALRRASIKVDEGETLFVTGPNGAGKSTLLKAIAGVVTPREGFIEFAGQHIAGKAPEDIARLGFSMVPEGREVFGSLTIE